MYASELISELQQLMSRHGDLEVTMAVSMHEYSANNIGYADEGPLPNLVGIQKQEPPDRFVIEAKDDLDSN